ncbi:MAG: hypothetical protein IPN77_31145 [Sandaracinaceae bacterium]|nr:hypothetical protein [Sandaracinaceae bacterium]
MSALRPLLLAGLLSVLGVACGPSSRPAAHPDFRVLQVHEARVSELTQVAGDESRPCADRSAAAFECDAEVERARQDLAGVHDEDASARVTRLAQQCDAAQASSEGRCGPDA